MQDRIFQVASKILDVPVTDINPHSTPQTLGTWDSLRHMNLIVALEEEFDIQFSDDEIGDLQSMSKIMGVIQRHAP